MAKVESTERANDFGLVGKLGHGYNFGERIYGGYYYGNEERLDRPAGFGDRIYGEFQYGNPKFFWGIYQRRHVDGKVTYAKLRFYVPSNPKTEAQQNWRATFADGMTAWGNLTNDEKSAYNERAKQKKLHGVNLFLREYLKSH